MHSDKLESAGYQDGFYYIKEIHDAGESPEDCIQTVSRKDEQAAESI